MVKQYPHYLFVVETTASTQDANGDFGDGTTTYRFVSMCREETNGKGNKLAVGDGQFIVFSSLIQLPFGSESLKEGVKVAVYDDIERTHERICGECLKFDEGQLHNRLWL